jgi:hypothetical protein
MTDNGRRSQFLALALAINKVQNMVDGPFCGCDGSKEAIDVSSPDFGGLAPIAANLSTARPEKIRPR